MGNSPLKNKNKSFIPQGKNHPANRPISSTLLDKMVDGREFESLLKYQVSGLDVVTELRKSIKEVEAVRHRPVVCYVANVVKPKNSAISIDDSDDLPFNEMISSLPHDCKEIDIVLVTPGGYAHQVAKFVNKLRPRFDNIGFIIPNMAMSAGTIFTMCGDNIFMTDQSQLGPIDPQVKTNRGEFVPAQSILTLIDEIKTRGEVMLAQNKKPAWTDILLLKGIDPKEIGNAHSASNYSIQLVKEYLNNHKFKNWANHSDGRMVIAAEKLSRADEIAKLLCEHSHWKNHGHAITREAAWEICKLKIDHAEQTPGLERAMKRMWALFYWVFENTNISKVFISPDYSIFRQHSVSDQKSNHEQK